MSSMSATDSLKPQHRSNGRSPAWKSRRWDDSTDETKGKVADIVEGFRSQGFDIHHIHRTNRNGHKAGALKEGLAVCRGEFVAIFDADFMPASDFLVKTVPYFDAAEIGMVQTRWGHINDDYSILTKAQSFGIDGHFMIEQVARNCNSLWMNFNGTGGICARHALKMRATAVRHADGRLRSFLPRGTGGLEISLLQRHCKPGRASRYYVCFQIAAVPLVQGLHPDCG